MGELVDLLVALDDAHAHFLRRLGEVTTDDWSLATPCGEWDVLGVATHLINEMVVYDALLTDTFSPELMESVMAIVRAPDTVGPVLDDASRRLRERFAEPGMFTKPIAYPVIEGFTGGLLACFSVTDCCVHAWDIAQALGVDGSFDEDLAKLGYDGCAPYNDLFLEVGFTKPPTTDRPTDDSAQARLLHLFGRC
jgi:uncharacterized protein (TIGR03086 family)